MSAEIPGVSELLTDLPLLSQVPADRREELSRSMRLQQFEAGAVLLQEGEPGHLIYFILKGRVRIWSDTSEAWMAEMGPGSMVGEIGALFGTMRTATVRATERVCVASLTGQELLSTLASVPTALDSIYVQARERYLRTHAPKGHGDFELARDLARRRIPLFSDLPADHQERLVTNLISAPTEHPQLVFGQSDQVRKVVMLSGTASLRQGFLPNHLHLDAGSTGTLDTSDSWLQLQPDAKALLLSLNDFYSLLDPNVGESICITHPQAEHPGVLAEFLEEDNGKEQGDLPLRHSLVAVLETPRQIIPYKPSAQIPFVLDETPKPEPGSRRYRDDPLPIEERSLIIPSSCSEADLKKLSARLSDRIEAIEAPDCPVSLDEFLSQVAKVCSNLQSLDLSGCKGTVSEDALINLVSRLDSITILKCPAITDRVLQAAHGADLLLECLDVSGSQGVSWKYIIRFHATLRKLTMRRCWWDEDTQKGNRQFMALEELDLSENPFLSDGQLLHLVTLMPKLERLSLRLCSSVSSSALIQISQLDLQHLDLSFCMRAVTDEVVIDGIARMKNLKSLYLRSCVQLSNRALKALLNMGLDHLNVSDCPRVTAARLIPASIKVE